MKSDPSSKRTEIYNLFGDEAMACSSFEFNCSHFKMFSRSNCVIHGRFSRLLIIRKITTQPLMRMFYIYPALTRT